MKNKTVLMTLATLAVVVFVIGTHAEAKTYGLEQGSRYEGFLQDGSRYKGQMKDGEKDGVGTIFYPDGGRLDGTWYQDKIEGAVLFAYEDGSYFKGNYKNDEKNGLGVLLDEDGEVEAGLWRNGEEIDSLRKKGNKWKRLLCGSSGGFSRWERYHNLCQRQYVYRRSYRRYVWRRKRNDVLSQWALVYGRVEKWETGWERDILRENTR